MATYVIGDIHGCFQTFLRLLEHLGFDEKRDRIWHTGDLVNGGPDSLETLRWFASHEDVATTVLGNHDLHFIAVAMGEKRLRKNDTFIDILDAPDRQELVAWLRSRPLLVRQGKRVLVHAGLLPQWTVEKAAEAAAEVEELLVNEPRRLLKVMYGNKPRSWDKAKTAKQRRRVTINAMTRMRVLRKGGRLDFNFKGTYETIPAGSYAWFDAPHPAWAGHQIIVGHWSALGLRHNERVVALDTGCRWGRKLTAFRLDDDQIFSVDSNCGQEI